ncbi:hypothetical protein [Kitasatospora sp. NPDC058218]|uniref:hypothetical protein n=1 Tax=Kitasatospora sp. NPDC058218 TaxID=3346385 RepID=UPI0036DA55DC
MESVDDLVDGFGLGAVVEVAAADAFDERGGGEEHAGGGSLLGCLAGGGGLESGEVVGVPVALQIGPDAAGHQGVGGDAVVGPAAADFDGEEDLGGFGLSVGVPGIVGAAAEEQVVEADG